jgi:hypothetical protein
MRYRKPMKVSTDRAMEGEVYGQHGLPNPIFATEEIYGSSRDDAVTYDRRDCVVSPGKEIGYRQDGR